MIGSGLGEAVIVFTRAPFDDSCKTRLAPDFDAAQRCALSRAMLADGLENALAAGRPVLVCSTPESLEGRMREIVGDGCMLYAQEGDGLGERMDLALKHAFSLGYGPCLLVGSDIPELEADTIEQAFESLRVHDVVLVPTFDGGYCLVGMKAPTPAAFPVMEYGSASVLQQTLASLDHAGASVAVLSPCYDIDTPDDLRVFLSRSPSSCPRTSAFACAILQGNGS